MPRSMTLQALFTQAAGLHQQGKLAQAEQLYLQFLQQDPGSVPGRHLLGVLRSQQGRDGEALELIGAALQASPRDFGALLNYGRVLQRCGRAAEALAAYDRALAVKPDFLEAHFNRGVLLFEQNRLAEALASYDRALAARPNAVEVHYNRGVVLFEMRRFAEALAAYDKALALNPRLVAALGNRGNVLRELQRPQEALASYDRALAIDAGLGAVHHNRGVVLAGLKRFAEALASQDRAIAIQPDMAAAHYNRGIALAELDRPEEALAAYDRALALSPGFAGALNNRGVTLWKLGRPDQALASYDRAVAAKPDFAEAWNNHGFALYGQRRYGEALASYDRALTLDPANARSWNGRGSALRELKRPAEALAAFDKAVALDPHYAEAFANRAIVHWKDREDTAAAAADLERVLAIDPAWPYARGELLHLRMQGCDWRDYRQQCRAIDAAVRAGKPAVRPFAYQAVSQSPADLQACSRVFAAAEFPARTPLAARGGREHEKIRIGYVSGEFREQATAHLMAGLYEQHDRAKFEIVGFDTGWHEDGPMRRRLEAAFGGFIDVSALSDEEAAQKVLGDEIDILVNLGGYFGRQRMGIFARRPAPVQVNYLGFPATLGADYIDYILADSIVIPEGDIQFYTEKVVWLPDSYQANDSARPIADADPGRAQAGLPEKAFVFCNFNQSYKLTPDMFAAWMRIMKQVEGSVLWLWVADGPLGNLRREAAARGVAGERLVGAPDLPPAHHLARLKLADLFLDSLPYNAHTTASDALWAGLPLRTCRGTAFPGRVAASLLQAAGLPELVAETMEDYQRRAVALARDPGRLQALRVKLAQNRPTCALFDTARFRRHIESAYGRMWDICRRGEAPRSFAV
jgi:predicted O-linked N-acetylglucosamine transferase (SPINDLY family)